MIIPTEPIGSIPRPPELVAAVIERELEQAPSPPRLEISPRAEQVENACATLDPGQDRAEDELGRRVEEPERHVARVHVHVDLPVSQRG